MRLLGVLLVLLGLAVGGCGGDPISSPSGGQEGPGAVGLLWVSTRDVPMGGAGALYRAELDPRDGTLAGVRRVTPEGAFFPWNDPRKVPGLDRFLCSMTMGSFLYNNVYSVDPTSGAFTALTSNDERNNFLPVARSRDLVYYASFSRDAGAFEVRSMAADGTGDTLVAPLPFPVGSMDLSPDGGTLVMDLQTPESTDLFVLDPAAGVVTRLAETPSRNEYAVSFRPSGDLLYLAEGGAGFDIFTSGAAGGNERRITHGEMPYNGPLREVPGGIVHQSLQDLYLYRPAEGTNVNLTGSQGDNYNHWVFPLEASP